MFPLDMILLVHSNMSHFGLQVNDTLIAKHLPITEYLLADEMASMDFRVYYGKVSIS